MLTPEILDKANEYLLGGYENTDESITSAVGLAQYLGVVKSTIYLWAQGDDDLSVKFSDTLRAVIEKQEKMLINRGLSGVFNPTITKLMLANHGYHEKQEIDMSSSDGSMSPTPARIELVAGPIPKGDKG